MGILEKELLYYVLGWLFRWLSSNDKNTKKKAEIDELKKTEGIKNRAGKLNKP